MERVAKILGGGAAKRAGLAGFVNSEFDRFLDQLFASRSITPRNATAALQGRPGFVWLAEKPSAEELGPLQVLEMVAMTAPTAPPPRRRPHQGEIGDVRSRDDLDGGCGGSSGAFGCGP